MATADKIPDDEWRLDDGSDEPEPQPAPPPTVAVTNLSAERLARAVYVVTVEHLAWYVVAGYAIVTRIAALGARPLDPAPARDALAAFYIAAHGRAAFALADASWVTILEGWIFAAAGANDANARIVVTLCGLILVAAAFAMRPVLGRAGALAFGAIVAISPSLTYFSRGGSTAIASVTFMIVAIAIAESMRRRPTIVRAAGLGAAIALWLTADPIGYVTAAAIVALATAGRRGRCDSPRPSPLAPARMVGSAPHAGDRRRDRRDWLVARAGDGVFPSAAGRRGRIFRRCRIRTAGDCRSPRNVTRSSQSWCFTNSSP